MRSRIRQQNCIIFDENVNEIKFYENNTSNETKRINKNVSEQIKEKTRKRVVVNQVTSFQQLDINFWLQS